MSEIFSTEDSGFEVPEKKPRTPEISEEERLAQLAESDALEEHIGFPGSEYDRILFEQKEKERVEREAADKRARSLPA